MRRILELGRRLRGLNPVLLDTVLVATITFVVFTYGFGQDETGFKEGDPTTLVLTCLTLLPAALRRLAPMSVLLFLGFAMVADTIAKHTDSLNNIGLLLTWYTVAATKPTRQVLLGGVFTFGVLTFAELTLPDSPVVGAVLMTGVLTVLGWAFGESHRKLGQRNEQLAALTERLRREQEDRALQAVTEERVRIARELHDVVAHHMSVVSVQAGLARYVFDSDPATAQASLTTIADTSSEALAEMRRLLAVLRIGADDGFGDYAPAPGLGRLSELADRVRDAGVPVEVTVTGTPRPLPSGLDLCAYRVVQESLTNVLKHARPASAHVALEFGRTEFVVRVVDDGNAGPAEDDGQGHGILGMRERARLYGGTLTAGAGSPEGFVVTLTLPLAAPNEGDSR